MRTLAILLLCLTLYGWADEMTISSDHAEYQGDRVVLTGNVVIETAQGILWAEHAHIDYAEMSHQKKIKQITLTGSVQLMSGQTDARQYALADRVEVFPAEDLVILRGDAGKKVTFYDRVKDVQLSASQVRMTRDAEGQESIQGIGEVRFVFKEEEFERLKRQFKWKEAS